MLLLKPHFEIITDINSLNILKNIERAGRTCYKSENKITNSSAITFVKNIITSGHESVIEHENLSVRFVCDRGISHEIVRHRLASYSQESSRYCNYMQGVSFIIPPWIEIEPGEYTQKDIESLRLKQDTIEWLEAMLISESRYISLLKLGWSAQMARSVLPNSLKTEIVMTANLREWRHVLKQRISEAAHPQMQELMKPLLKIFNEKIPVVFDDIY
jgi:thymidylate synthase (FAD)